MKLQEEWEKLKATGEEYTIRDLENLEIDGYNISCTVTDEKATIVMGGYTFYIDSNFVLTEE